MLCGALYKSTFYLLTFTTGVRSRTQKRCRYTRSPYVSVHAHAANWTIPIRESNRFCKDSAFRSCSFSCWGLFIVLSSATKISWRYRCFRKMWHSHMNPILLLSTCTKTLQVTRTMPTIIIAVSVYQLPSPFRQPHSVHCPRSSPHPAHTLSPYHSHHLCSHHLPLPRSFTPCLKLISFTNPFLHSHSPDCLHGSRIVCLF